jgi:diguanylate cyclase (GGDEF)-like protein
MQGRIHRLLDPNGAVIGCTATWQDLQARSAAIRAFATLAEGTRVLLRATDERDLLQQMCEAAASVGGYAFSWYGIPVHDADKSVKIVAVGGNDMGYTKTLKTSWGDGPLAQGPTGLSIKSRTTQVRNNLAEDPRFAPWRDAAASRGINCSISLPVIVHGEVHGALMVYAFEPGSFDARAQDLLEALAADLGYGLERFRDAEALAESRAALEHEIEFDSLTGLAKQRLSLQRIQDILDTHDEPSWALLCVGVHGLTAINQAYTYAAGDEVLHTVAQRLVAAAGAHDRVGRIAGDEFVVLMRGLVTSTDAAESAQRIINAVSGPLEFSGVTLDINVCVGIAMSDGLEAEPMLRDASAAMRAAAHQGPGTWSFLDQNVAAHSRMALDVQLRLREALASGQIVAWFMPQISFEDDSLRGYEALVRWVLPDGTVMPPDTFLSIAERSNLILEIDRTVLGQSFDALTRLDPALHVAVNVSAATLRSGALEGLVLDEAHRTGVDVRRLHLEVTETALLSVTQEIRDAMQRVADLGINWWLDDFGTGYSSISHLRDLPIQGVKLDQSFTVGLVTVDSHLARLTRGLAGLARGLDLRTVAEGVETAEQAAMLRGQGWEMAQGWHFGKPAPLPE